MSANECLDSITSVVDAFVPNGGNEELGWTLAPPAIRKTARYGIRRPKNNTYPSVIYSQAPVLPTDPTRVTPRKACRRGAGDAAMGNDVLESKELLCGDCIQPVRGPGEPAWVSAYRKRDELQQLLIDSEARDALIRQAYENVASQSYQTEQKPVLCKALQRLYQHDAYRPMRANPNWTEEDWKVARWYCKNCYPYVSAAGSVTWFERPLVPKSWIDNVVRTLGPIYNYMSQDCACVGNSSCSSTYNCPCAPTNNERAVYPRAPPSASTEVQSVSARLPTQNQIARAQRTAGQNFFQTAQAANQAQVMQHYTGNLPNQGSVLPAPQDNMYNNCFQACQSGCGGCTGGVPRGQTKDLYGLFTNDERGAALRAKQARLVAKQKAQLDAANPDYAQRVYEAQVVDHRVKSGKNQLRMSRFLDPNNG